MSIDLAYDHYFEGRGALCWWPWVGSGFSGSAVKTMVVGESIYEWHPEIEAFNRRYSKADGLRVTHTNHAMDFERDSPYVRNIERAIFSTPNPKNEQKLSLWTSVAYHNLVLQPLPSSGHRPSLRQYLAGWAETLDLCQVLSVSQCLVYGLEPVKLTALKQVAAARGVTCSIRRAGPKISRNYPRVATVDLGTTQLKLLFVRHPSSFFSWRKWGPVIRDNLPLSFPS